MRSQSPIARSVLLTVCTMLLSASSLAAWSGHAAQSTARLEMVHGYVGISIRPDHGQSLPLTQIDSEHWAFEGPTQALVGGSYSIVLDNHTSDRLKVVVGIDGLNIYHREPIVGRSDRDTGSILSAWSERTLRGWQLDRSNAHRFVFSPPEWSEGQGWDESKIGLISIHVYRERPRWWQKDSGRLRSDSSQSRRSESERQPAAESAPIGTTSGEEVESHVRTVRFETHTLYPEALAEIDYGQAKAWPEPRIEPLLGLDLERVRDGSRIVAIARGSAAESAGLELSDVIIRVDTQSRPSPSTLRQILRSKDRGDYVFLRVRRAGRHEIALKIQT